MVNPIQRPNRPNPVPRPQRNQVNNVNRGGNQNINNNQGGGNNRGNDGGNNNNNNPQPSPWLLTETPPIDNTASFVEYLRWMREPNYQYKDGTKVQILHLACETANNYKNRLSTLNQRTKLMAGENNTFLVKSSWRIRVGGHRGPENILLPAFDALGMPFLPSSSLRGVARNYAIREIMNEQKLDWKTAEKQIAPYFGSIDTNNKADQAGKIVFFDAYPTEGKLAMDIANNIWQWEDNNLKYSPNPNPFLSLKEGTFLIGIKLASHCQDNTILTKVKQWLIKGLEEGLGSQINTGYGQLIEPKSRVNNTDEFFRVQFRLKGQLIHGSQAFTQWKQNNTGQWQMRGQAIEEVRSTAFKSMLRYWFRVFALGVLPLDKVQELEGNLFGSINPKQAIGWVKFNIFNSDIIHSSPRPNYQGENDECGEQKGILSLSYSPYIETSKKEEIASLFQNLIWLSFRLGGIGQGARRPCYKRNNAPWYRGSKIYPKTTDDKFWLLSPKIDKLTKKFQSKIQDFYQLLGKITNQNQLINNATQNFGKIDTHKWYEVMDRNCQIILISGNTKSNKPLALDVLHQYFHQLENHDYSSAKSLCGGVKKDQNKQRDVIPSPIWISDLQLFQVVTIFGATQNPRQRYIQELRNKADQFVQIFPFQ